MWWLGLIPVPCSSLYMESRHRPWTSVPITNSDSTPMCRYNVVCTVSSTYHEHYSSIDNSEHTSMHIYSTHIHTQQWQYPRSKLTYMRELGEGQFGKVLLMEARVSVTASIQWF